MRKLHAFLSLQTLSFILPIFLLMLCGCGKASSIPPTNRIPTKGNDALSKACQHLADVMDKFHKTFDVYTDAGAAGNHFVMIAKMAKDDKVKQVKIDVACTENPHSGATCIKNTFTGLTELGGCYFQNGVLSGVDRKPSENWGKEADAGYNNLIGATKLTFWARGAKGGEWIEFFAFGVGRKLDTGKPENGRAHPDSSPKVSQKENSGYIELSKEWKQYSIDLEGCNLTYVIGGFGWATNANMNPDGAVVFYLDDIKYILSEKCALERLKEPRFLVSYETIASDLDFDTVMRNVGFTYDNAMALLAFIAVDDKERAKLLADAFVYAQNNDRYFFDGRFDGRLRNAYQAGDLRCPPGWRPNNRKDTVRLPGFWDKKAEKWYEDYMQVGSYAGNIAWVIIALLSYQEKYDNHEDSQYLKAAEKMGDWIQIECYDIEDLEGYKGGYDGWEPGDKQKKVSWKSTEHNLDLYVAFTRLQKATGDKKWREKAEHAKRFVEAMWSKDENRYYTGSNDGVTPNKSKRPLDVNTWALLVLGITENTKAAIQWVENNCKVTKDGSEGFDFNDDKDGIWWEGTAQMVVVYKMLGEKNKALKYLNELRRAQSFAPGSNGKGIVAASHDGVTTGLMVKGIGPDEKEREYEWLYYRRLHVGATAWFIFAELGKNPYW